MMLVFFRQFNHILGQAPIDGNIRIIPSQSTLGRRFIQIVAFILKNSRFAQHHKTMRETLGNEKLTLVFARQFHRHMLSVSRTAFANIHRHIHHPTVNNTHQFSLRMRWTLKMQTSQHAIRAIRLIILYKDNGRIHLFGKFLRIVTFKKVTSVVAKNLWLDNKRPFYRGFNYFHSTLNYLSILHIIVIFLHFVDHLEQILAILVFNHRLCQFTHTFFGNPSLTISNAFQASHLQTLTFFYHFHKS